MLDKNTSLAEEYKDLEEEYSDCGDKEERQRCASRMDAIITELRESSACA